MFTVKYSWTQFFGFAWKCRKNRDVILPYKTSLSMNLEYVIAEKCRSKIPMKRMLKRLVIKWTNWRLNISCVEHVCSSGNFFHHFFLYRKIWNICDVVLEYFYQWNGTKNLFKCSLFRGLAFILRDKLKE